jgi:hypothetical protein
MTEKVYALDTKSGIQRDGTVFDKNFYNSGRWVRFQRGRPRKIGGYREIAANLAGPSRGIYVNPQNAFTNVFNGYSDGLQVLAIDGNGVGSGVNNFTLNNFTKSIRNLWQFDTFTDITGSGNTLLLAHPGQDLVEIDSDINTPVLGGPITGTTLSKIGTFTDSVVTVNGSPVVTIENTNTLIGAGQIISGTGIPSGTTVVSTTLAADNLSSVAVTGTSGTFSCAATSGLYVNQTVTVSGSLGTQALDSVAVTGTSGTFSCTATTGLYAGQKVVVSGSPTAATLSSVAITGANGTFSCSATTGLAVGQTVEVSGTFSTNTLASVAVTDNNGAFSCTATTGLYVGMPLTVTGTQAPETLLSVAVTGTAGQCSCTPTNGLYVGQAVVVTGTFSGSSTGISANQIYYIISTNGTSTFTLSATYGGNAITTTAGTTTGLTFKATMFSGVLSGVTYYITATNGTSTFSLSQTRGGATINTVITSLSGLTFAGPVGTGLSSGLTYYIVATNGTSTFTLSAVSGGSAITNTYGATTGLTFKTYAYTGVTTGTTYYITTTNGTSTFTLSATSGGSAITTVVASLAGLTFTIPKSIGLDANTTYYITATNYSTTFTLSATKGGSAVTTIVTGTTGFVFTLGQYQKVTMSANATATGVATITFDNNISVSGGVVTLHPYVFVYGNNGFIKNCASGNLQDWVSADANEVNVATGKIVQGLPVRGGSNAPSGLFWSLDSLVRVSYAPTTINVGTTAITQYWRYDVISSQTSILSSQSIIEYDGIYYWCGVDRFLAYNGVVKEITNDMNQNYFFDNLNYNQRQKVWATKVPRYGEIWWFYPRGDATECTDAIIYNIREQTWYDAGEAAGARRSAGYFSQVFHFPINASWEANLEGAIDTLGINTPGSSYTNGVYPYVALTGGTGTGATATITVAGNVITQVVVDDQGSGYTVGDLLTASIPGGTGYFSVVQTIQTQVSLYQHEFGVNQIKNSIALAVESFFETNDLGWVSGGPAQPSMEGVNRWLHLERVEPDFLQQGDMELYVTGRPFADSQDKTTGPYVFGQNTGKIDLREQRRELRLKFVSNTLGGDYQVGRIIVNANIGDTRPY